MTMERAIERFDLTVPNAFPFAVKPDLVMGLEARLENELFSLYVAPSEEDAPEDPAGDGVPLAAPYPYDDLYVKFLAAETDRLNGDVNRYQNSAKVFNDAYDALALHLLRTRRRRRRHAVRLPEVTA